MPKIPNHIDIGTIMVRFEKKKDVATGKKYVVQKILYGEEDAEKIAEFCKSKDK